MAKEIIYGADARDKMLNGVKKVADAVKTTLGPSGRFVIIEKENSNPLITKDGVTVARNIELEDKFENLGAALIKEVAAKTDKDAGDNTTSSTVLAYAIAKEGYKAVKTGTNPIDLKNGIDKAVKEAVTSITEMSRPVSSADDITNVATVSANNDPEIGNILAQAVEKVGKDGVITVEESKNIETTVKTVEGLQIDKGYISPYFSTDKDRLETYYENPYILITDKKISSMKELMPILEQVVNTNQPLLIIADEVEGEALGTLVVNSMRGSLKSVAIRAPGFGDDKKNQLEDIAALTGGTVISESLGYKLETTTLDQLGKAKSIKVTKDDTTIIGCNETKDAIKERVKMLKKQEENAKSEYDRNKIVKRIARLGGGLAVISVGAATETELKEKKFRVEDTIAATKAALEDGIIPGGGIALLNASVKLNSSNLTGDEKVGYEIIKAALKEPTKQIAENSGVNGDVVVAKILESDIGIGYNAKTATYEDMMKSGIIDTAKAMKKALINAASIAGTLLSTECAITEIPKKEESQIQPMMY